MSRIEEVGVKSIFPRHGKEPEPSVWLNLTNFVLSKSPKFITLGHPNAETADIRNLEFVTATKGRTVTGCGGARKGMIGWVISMILKL